MITHYDNLKVSRDAPTEIIRAAYKVLSQKYSADQHQNDDASNVLDRLNDSYAILSNPAQRAEYDRWLSEQQSPSINATTSVNEVGIKNKNSDRSDYRRSYRWFVIGVIGIGTLALIGWFVFSRNENASKTEPAILQVENTSNTLNQPAVIEPSTDLANNTIPVHDQVPMKQFIGKWKGENASSVSQQTLEISSKSDNSLIFLLDAKAGQGIGGVYGIADYQAGYVRFFNAEYGCSIVFTMMAGTLHVTTSGCQAYHAKGVTFDGSYVQPTIVKTVQKPVVQIKPSEPTATSENAIQTQQIETQSVVAKITPKLVKFIATVKDAEGNESTFELVAKDKKAAKDIIRDFRGNPKIVKIKEVKK